MTSTTTAKGRIAFTFEGDVYDGDVIGVTQTTAGLDVEYTYVDALKCAWHGVCHLALVAPNVYRGDWRDTSGPPAKQNVKTGASLMTGDPNVMLSGAWTLTGGSPKPRTPRAIVAEHFAIRFGWRTHSAASPVAPVDVGPPKVSDSL